MAKEYARTFYKSKAWQEVRRYVLMRDNYLCTKCGELAEEVHHIIHLTHENITDTSISLNEKNLTCLCKDCHFKEHEEDRTKKKYDYEFDSNGMLIPKNTEE